MAQTTRKKKSSGARNGSKRNAPAPEKTPTYKEGDAVKVLTPESHKGEVVGVLEVDNEDGAVRTEFGWLTFDQVQPAPKSRAQRMDVDGKTADVVLDGKTGAPKDDALIRPALEDLVRALAKANEQLGRATIAKKRASEAHKDAQGAVNSVVDELVRHYGETHPQLTLGITQAAADANEDDVEDEEDERPERQPVGVGARNYPAGEGPE